MFKDIIVCHLDIYYISFRYGAAGYSETEVRQEMVDLDKHLQSERFKYAWISSANVEYEESLAQIHFLSNIHAKVLDTKYRDQSFTSLMADLRQTEFLHLAGALMEHFHEGIALLSTSLTYK